MKLPKDCRDWKDDLITCASAKYVKQCQLNKRGYDDWRIARDLLSSSTDPVFIQKTGDKKVNLIFYVNIMFSTFISVKLNL
jgi:hypothetical protein